MRAGNRPERENQYGENSAGGKCVAQKCQRAVSVRQLRGHDAGADYGRQQKCRTKPFGGGALRERGHQVGSVAFAVAPAERPISFGFFCRLSRSSKRNGNAVNIPMRC